MNRQINFRILMAILALFALFGCSTYPGRFKCGDAKGLGCAMLHEVNRQIDSGQIEEAYKDRGCRSKNCSLKATTEILNLRKRDKADSYQDKPAEIVGDANNLYF